MSALTLRHTGLQVPDDRIKLAGPGLIALEGEIVGEVGIDTADDFAEVFRSTGSPPILSEDAFFDWVAQCRTISGDPIDPEDIFTYLRAEYATEFALRQAAKNGVTVAQSMVPHGDGYLPGQTLIVFDFETRADVLWRAEQYGMPEGAWWRIFNGVGWDDLKLNR